MKHWFRPAGRPSFVSRDKRRQKRLPLHPALRFASGFLTPSLFQGHAPKGHPCLGGPGHRPLAASMPLKPPRPARLHNDSVRPPERGVGVPMDLQARVMRRAAYTIRQVVAEQRLIYRLICGNSTAAPALIGLWISRLSRVLELLLANAWLRGGRERSLRTSE